MFGLQEIEPSVGERLCHLWDKIPPSMTWVPKNSSMPPQTMFHQIPNSNLPYRAIRGQLNHNQHQFQHTNNSYSHPPPSYMNQQRKS